MRKSLLDLINKTIVYKYDLPNSGAGIFSTIYSTENDRCYAANDKDDIAEIIFNSIIEYSFNEFDITGKDYQALHTVALRNKLKYNPAATEETKIKYGFFGEVLLYSLLMVMFKAKPLIARGYFYNPLENAETKGYDSYQLVENKGITELWFGEVKFHISHISGINSVMENIDKALSDWYFENNIIAIHNHKNNLNLKGSKIEVILNEWEQNPIIKIGDEIKKHGIKLVYPILLLYEDDLKGYDGNIKKIPEYIKKKFSAKKFSLSIDYSIFFILLPIEKVKETKLSVIQWIESRKPPML
ncbi:Hachiman antiphage defense system protein HamA [Flavobacterium sp. PL02]|uniref:Hachiman antiphage defense system protein HamA n=1 Tax=Flavobacterium sp. PL02 TaxID=3088354 RepID=UPI002B23207A|nr:Hachiman antiphage defense system protein HamA [Flavobacterium sp. PL02]MEA9414338.1 Hachiman antiphage defense system protein HamA [Flavobacterium sp. PL02]